MRLLADTNIFLEVIRFIETTATTQHVAEGIAVDYAADGRIAGIEILDARSRLLSLPVIQECRQTNKLPKKPVRSPSQCEP